MTTTVKRRMSLEDDFMDHSTNDLLYGFMRCLSTSKENEGEVDSRQKRFEYLTFKEFSRYKKVIGSTLGCSSRTINNQLAKLEEAGLVQEVIMPLYCEQNHQIYDTSCYIFPYDYDGNYKIIEKNMLKYLVDTRNGHVIRVYLYLLNKFDWKPDYVFTLEEIKTALGFSPSYSQANITVSNILDSLKREGIISYEKKWFPIDNHVGHKQTMTQKMVLKNVLKQPPH